MWRLALLPFLAHSLGMLLDEAWFHRRRGLPAWERWGHPLDTLTVLACYGLVLALPPSRGALIAYLGAAAFSTLFITKDEWIHARRCTGGEMWLHAFLFVLHPVLLGLAGAWRFASPSASQGNMTGTLAADLSSDAGRGFFGFFLAGQTALTALFLGYQILYWNGPWKPALPPAR
ncbi:MAG TPA: hypothetical protein VJ385_18555 [Fibrobacteria bacterium]|nr:hypothetical protein [Fibrobacteria bacterium]